MNRDEELDRLYGSPLREFTRIRNELAKGLAKSDEGEAAAEIKALKKPSLSAWAVNQLARSERMQVRSLLTASEQVRDAQEKVLRGGEADELRDAGARQREVVDALLASAKGILRSAGHPATEATLERIRKTLTAVASDDEGRRLVEAGRLVEDLEPAGFGPFAAGPVAVPAKPASRAARGARERRIQQAEKKLEAAQAEAAEARERVEHARDELQTAERAAEAAKRALATEERKLERLRARAQAATAELERARST
jgi:DNA repair exonuclease SbcCD ATPase subunit